MFELLYLEYQAIASGECTDVNKLATSYSLYEQLRENAKLLYDNTLNKTDWVRKELLTLIDPAVEIPLPISKEFKTTYTNSFLRFELIDDYLKSKNLLVNITQDLNQILDKYPLNLISSNQILYIILKMITNAVLVQDTIKIIDKTFNKYEIEKIMIDKTLIYEFEFFFEKNFDVNEFNYFRNKYPTLFLVD